jgi:hypothetical protein
MGNNVHKALPPSDNNQSEIKPSAWELEKPDKFMYSLEALMHKVNKDITQGEDINEILRRKRLPQVHPTTGRRLMTDEQYMDYSLSFYQTRTSKGYNPAIGIRHVRSDIWDTVYFITRSPEDFPGKALRLVSVVETCMIHVGLHGLDLLLVGRLKIVQNRKNAIRKGGKEKRRRRLIPPSYRFVNFVDVEEKQQNIYCLSREDYARAAAIAEDYGWDFGFVIQMAMITAIASSEKLPENLRNNATEEIAYFKEYLNKVY